MLLITQEVYFLFFSLNILPKILPTSRIVIMNTKKMRQQIVECAQRLLQERGYHGWSYQDISNQVGIRKATIHYYFPFKENLGEAALADYYAQLFQVLKEIEERPGSNEE